jgi:hypothetical protein
MPLPIFKAAKFFSRLCIKVEKMFNTTRLSGALGGQKSSTWTLRPSPVHLKLRYYIGWWSTWLAEPARRPMPGLSSGDDAACADPQRRPVWTTHVAPAYYRGHRCRFLRTPSGPTSTAMTFRWLDPDTVASEHPGDGAPAERLRTSEAASSSDNITGVILHAHFFSTICPLIL